MRTSGRHLLLLMLAALCSLGIAQSALAFDDERAGFVLGGALGGGLRDDLLTVSGPTGESPGFRSSSGSFVTDLIIGWNFGGQWLVHHYEPAHWFSLDGATTVTGLGGIAVTRYLAPEAPCWLLRFGLGSYERWVFHASELEKADAGLGIGVGFGRELSPHLSLECDLTWGTPKVEADGFTSEMETLGVSLAVKALAY